LLFRLGLGRSALARNVADGFEGGLVVYRFSRNWLDFGDEKPLLCGIWRYAKFGGHLRDCPYFIVYAIRHDTTITDTQKKIKKNDFS